MDNAPANKDGQWNSIPPVDPFMSYGLTWRPNQVFNQNVSLYTQPNDYNMYNHLMANRNNQGPVIGLQALCAACTRLYPDQPNPLQVTARLKYWLGGPDPLDYISMYWNVGHPELNIPPHWHYISFGLSDLHGDGRVHPHPPMGPLQPDQISGLGLELSFRMIGEPGRPPTWPAALLQRLATYVFSTGNRFCVGDHVSWHNALDGSDENDNVILNKGDDASCKKRSRRKSKIRHMLIAQDMQLGTVDTPLGKVQFVQIVGVTDRELKAAQRSGGASVLEAISADPRCGGPWFITNMERRQSVNLPNSTHTPSDLSGVAATCHWEYWEPNDTDISSFSQNKTTSRRDSSELPQNVKEQIKCILQKGLSEINLQSSRDTSNQDIVSENSNAVQVKTEPKSVGSQMLQSDNNKNLLSNCKTSMGMSETVQIKTEPINDQTKLVQCDNNDLLNECKMSTDSGMFTFSETSKSIENIINSSQKDLKMSTDSFEMSKISIALLEDTKSQTINKLDNIELCLKSSESQFDKSKNIVEPKCTKSSTAADNNSSPQGKYTENQNTFSDRKCKCECVENPDEQLQNCVEVNPAILSEINKQNCSRCAVNELWTQGAVSLPGVHLIFDRESGSLLPLALRCRILHGRHFTWKAVSEVQAITLVATNVSGAIVSSEKPIAANNGWLQILISDDFAEEMAKDLEVLLGNDVEDSDDEDIQPHPEFSASNPVSFVWPNKGLKISIINNGP